MLPQDKRVVLFVAGNMHQPRKGLDILVRAMGGREESREWILATVSEVPARGVEGVDHRYLGKIGNDGLMSLAYSAADLCVVPSRQDNLPNTVLESMACGTPVVASDAGGIPDMVRPGVTGELAPPEDAETLGAMIVGLLQNEEKRSRIAEKCRPIALEEYSPQVQARQYSDLYERILGNAE
jgi:glycosyltransferase involved in cell wall biosynthesis